MGGYRPVPLDQLPIPQAAEPTKFTPAPIDQPPTPQPPGAGYMKAGGQVADIASNFLTGWLKGKQQAEQKKLAMAQQNMEGLHYGFQIAQQNAAQVAQDPNATPDAKAKAEQARQAAWKAYLDGAEQYTTPQKGQKSGGGGGGGGKGGQDSGFKAKMKQTFGAEDPHLFSQGAMALLRTTGPPAVPQPSAQEKLANMEYGRKQKKQQLLDQLEAAQKTGDAKQIEAAQNTYKNYVQNIEGKFETPKEKLDNMLAQALQDWNNGKEPSPQVKSELEAAGYIPKPVAPHMFQRIDDKGMAWIDVFDEKGNKIGSSQEGKTRVPPDQRWEAWQIKQDELKFVRQLMTPSIKAQHPDWTDKQVETEVNKQSGEAILAGDFKVKMGGATSTMPKADVETAISKALDEIHRQGVDESLWNKVVSQGFGAAGGWGFNDQVAGPGFWARLKGETVDSEAQNYKQDLIAQVREILERDLKVKNPKATVEQIDQTIDEMMGEPGRPGPMEPTPDKSRVGMMGAKVNPDDPGGFLPPAR